MRDSWHSVWGILEHLHPDDDERPPIPSASSHETPIEMENTTSEMEVDREVGVPPPALPPVTPRVVDASPNSSRNEITNRLPKIHQIGHRDNRTLVRLLKQRGTHPWVFEDGAHRCSACEESKPPALRHITSSYENVPGAILEIDGMHWQHPVTGCHARCQFMVDVGSRAPMVIVFEETRESCTRNNQTSECKESLLKDWFVHRGRPRLIRMDPDGCYMSNEMLDTLHHELGINTEVIPGEAPWKLSITGVILRLVKRTAHIYALDHGRAASCQECLLQAVMAHSRLLKHGRYTPLQLLFGHEPATIEGEALDDEQQGRSITMSMAEQSAMKAWLQAEAESRIERAQKRRTRVVQHWPSGTRVCYWRADCPSTGSLPTNRQGSTALLNKHKGAWFRVLRQFWLKKLAGA